MFKNSKVKPAAWKFLDFLFTKAPRVEFTKGEGFLPTTKAEAQDPYFTGNARLQTFVNLLPTAHFAPTVTGWEDTAKAVTDAVQSVYLGKAEPAAALKPAADEREPVAREVSSDVASAAVRATRTAARSIRAVASADPAAAWCSPCAVIGLSAVRDRRFSRCRTSRASGRCAASSAAPTSPASLADPHLPGALLRTHRLDRRAWSAGRCCVACRSRWCCARISTAAASRARSSCCPGRSRWRWPRSSGCGRSTPTTA